MSDPLSPGARTVLLQIAREALESAVRREPIDLGDPSAFPPQLAEMRASFVTLTCRAELRGCLGSLVARYPLWKDVSRQTAAAATRDLRFAPLRVDELGRTVIHISVLSRPEKLMYNQPAEIPALLRPGIDGLVLSGCGKRATFLPQVWEKIDDSETFLGMLCQKAGLEAFAWRSGALDLHTYQVESVAETDPQTRQAGPV